MCSDSPIWFLLLYLQCCWEYSEGFVNWVTGGFYSKVLLGLREEVFFVKNSSCLKYVQQCKQIYVGRSKKYVRNENVDFRRVFKPLNKNTHVAEKGCPWMTSRFFWCIFMPDATFICWKPKHLRSQKLHTRPIFFL